MSVESPSESKKYVKDDSMFYNFRFYETSTFFHFIGVVYGKAVDIFKYPISSLTILE